ncbi:MAG: hypothetical protein ACKOX6_11335 [Bdellovibrio sp.]
MATLKQMIQEAKMNAEVEVTKYSEMETQYDIDMKAAQDAGYDQALKDQEVPATDKIYTEADLQAEKKFLQDQIDALNADKAAAAQAQADAVAAAVQANKLDIAAKIRNANIDDLALADELETTTQSEAQA